MNLKKLSVGLLVLAFIVSTLAVVHLLNQVRALSDAIELQDRRPPAVTRCEIDPLRNTELAIISQNENCQGGE